MRSLIRCSRSGCGRTNVNDGGLQQVGPQESGVQAGVREVGIAGPPTQPGHHQNGPGLPRRPKKIREKGPYERANC